MSAASPSLHHYVGLNRTPALALAVRGWMDLIESQHCSNYVQVTAEQDAFVAFVDDAPAAVLTYRHDPLMKEVVVGIGYVMPAFRGQGLYRLLWDALVARAREIGAANIHSATFLDNTAMRSVARAQGRVERTVTLDYPL